MVFEFNFVISGLFLSCLLLRPFAEAIDCTSSKQEWIKLRYTALTNFQSLLNTAPASDVCQVPDGSSCCDREMQREMYVLAHQKLVQQGNSWLHLARQMENHSTALQYFFRSDLDHAKNRLHQFFSRIYGYNYKLHRSFFFGFFTDLEEYMAGRRGKLGQLVDNFFNQLRDSIVGLIERSGQVNSSPIFNEISTVGGTVSGTGSIGSSSTTGVGGTNNPGFGHSSSSASGNSAGSNDEATETRRIRCLSDRVAQVRPFDDVDVRLRARMLEAYPPARMLVNVLLTTSRILTHLTDRIAIRSECVTAVTRYHFCAICAGRSLNDVCPDSCHRLLSAACFKADGPNEAQLNFIWPQLIDAIILATSRLERSFNFPAVNRHLQMEISEAITSLQTRYAETKSKFESECRFGSTGRKVPNLFNPTNPNSRDLTSSVNRPSWSLNARIKRSTSTNQTDLLNRPRRMASAQLQHSASPELLGWQTRQRFPSPSSSSSSFPIPMGSNPSDYGSHSSSWDATDADDSSNVPDRLIRWAGQLKRTYTAVRNLFNQPAGDLCSDRFDKESNLTGSQTRTGNCWNPPTVESTPDSEITLVLRHLNEAAQRLQEASTSTRDPDTIVLHLQPRSSPRHAIYPKNVQRDSFGSSNHPSSYDTRNQYTNQLQNRWLPNPTQPDYSNPSNQLGIHNPTHRDGSGIDPTVAGSGMEPVKQVDHFYGQVPPPKQQQHKNWDRWQTNRVPPNEWESSGTGGSGGEQDGFLDNNAGSMTSTSTLPTSPPPPPPPIKNTTVMTTTTTTTTTTSRTSIPTRFEEPTRATFSEPSTVRTTSFVASGNTTTAVSQTKPDSFYRKEVWPPGPYGTPPMDPIGITTVSYTPNRMDNRFGHPDSYGLLPDDEDKVQQTGRDSDQSPPVHDPNQWSPNSGSPNPNHWELNPNQGSGLSPNTFSYGYDNFRQGQEQNTNRNKYEWSQQGPNQSPQGSSQYIYPEGSGGGSPQSELHPSRERPSQWPDRYNENAPSFPDSVGSGTTPTSEWPGRSKDEYSSGSHQWREQVEGSATATPDYTPTQSYDETSSRQFETMAPRPPPPPPREHHIPSLVPHPPLPPAEVWIPARLAPGQPAPSILFIREYNIEGPLYEHENAETAPTGSSCLIKVQASYLVLILFFLSFFHVYV